MVSPAKLTTVAVFKVEVAGAEKPELKRAFAEIIVESSLFLPDMFTIRLQDRKGTLANGSIFAFGQEVKISATAAKAMGGQEGVLINGEVTALEPDFSAQADSLFLVRGYGKGHRLHYGRYSRTFQNQSDSDIAQKIAQEASLQFDVDTTSHKYEYVLQKNQTNMEFLSERAERIGFQVFEVDGKLFFKEGSYHQDATNPIPLLLGESLRIFRPRATIAHQASSVEVHGWDWRQKKSFVGKATPDQQWKQGGWTKAGGEVFKSAIGDHIVRVTDRSLSKVDEANAIAAGLSSDVSSSFIEADGICRGDPRIKAGTILDIDGVGDQWKGKYYVTTAAHIWSAAGYETHFTVAGRQPNTISRLLTPPPHNGRAQVNGVVVGLVTNIDDTENLGRVRVQFPWLPVEGQPAPGTSSPGADTSTIETFWARIATPMAGAERGFFYLPEVNDEVLLAFENGDASKPYVVGALWNGKDAPPAPTTTVVKAGKVVQRIIHSRSGHRVVLDDSDDKRSILIEDKGGTNQFFIDSTKNEILVKSKGNMTLDVGGNLLMKVMGNTTIDSKGKIEEKTNAGYALTSMAKAEITTTGQYALTATGGFDIMSPADGAIQTVGGLQLMSAGETKIFGSMVKINSP